MLKNKQELIKFLENKSSSYVFNNELTEKIRDYMFDKYNISTGTTMDMIARGMFEEQTEFILFCFVDSIDINTNSDYKKEFFTDIEINQYSKEKLITQKIKLPIRIKCDQVGKDQWIGAANSQFFMDLRRAQLIKYNVNAQRVMKRIIKGESVLFRIVLNKLAINAIKVLMQKNLYIPTTITLNIPFDSDAEFYFDEKERELVVKKIDNFDISDGYHRYMAMSALSDENPDFNYPMEIRIINFTDEKTRQFIYQEDQKTKMAKSDSETMNINRPSNNVVDRLNEMSTFDFKGQIGRQQGAINYGMLSDFIEYFYFKQNKTYTNIDIRNVANEIKDRFNALAEVDSDYINKNFTFKDLAVIFHVFEKESDLSKAAHIIDSAFKEDITKKFNNAKLSKPLFNAIDKLL